MHNSQLTYWIYAIIAKAYGREVKIKRDPMHRQYEVNRHGVYLTSQNIDVKKIRDHLEATLSAAGYVLGGSSKSFPHFYKVVGRQEMTVSISEERSLANGQRSLYVYPRIYHRSN